MRTITATLLGLALLAPAAGTAADYPTSYPFPDTTLQSGPEIRFCIDKRNPTWRAQQAIAEEIALNLGRPAEFHVAHEASDARGGYHNVTTRQAFLVLLARHCDAFMGLPGSTTAAFDYPADEEMLASRPYYRTSFVLVSRDPAVAGLTDLAPDDRLALQGRGVPYLLLMQTRPDSVTVERYTSTGAILDALEAGEVKHGVVYAPGLYERLPQPQAAGLHVRPVTSLPNMEWFVFAGLRSDRPTLRQKFDRAIARLLQSGRMGEILAGAGLPTTVFRPAELGATLPDDDFGGDPGEDDGA